MKNKTFKKIFQNQEGQVALLMVFVIMTLLLFIALFLTNVVAKQMKIARNNLNSIQAYYLADMGAERALYGITRSALDLDKINLTFFTADTSDAIPDLIISQNNIAGEGSFTVVKTGDSSPVSIKASGVFRETSRAIELSWY